MASDHSIRASDQDREVVVATLRDAYTAGRLTLEEFDDRTTTAYASKTWGELRKLTEDLPAQPVLGADVPGRRLPAHLPQHPERGREMLPPARRRPRPVALFSTPPSVAETSRAPPPPSSSTTGSIFTPSMLSRR